LLQGSALLFFGVHDAHTLAIGGALRPVTLVPLRHQAIIHQFEFGLVGFEFALQFGIAGNQSFEQVKTSRQVGKRAGAKENL
jgi:hypothetical protein